MTLKKTLFLFILILSSCATNSGILQDLNIDQSNNNHIVFMNFDFSKSTTNQDTLIFKNFSSSLGKLKAKANRKRVDQQNLQCELYNNDNKLLNTFFTIDPRNIRREYVDKNNKCKSITDTTTGKNLTIRFNFYSGIKFLNIYSLESKNKILLTRLEL